MKRFLLLGLLVSFSLYTKNSNLETAATEAQKKQKASNLDPESEIEELETGGIRNPRIVREEDDEIMIRHERDYSDETAREEMDPDLNKMNLLELDL